MKGESVLARRKINKKNLLILIITVCIVILFLILSVVGVIRLVSSSFNRSEEKIELQEIKGYDVLKEAGLSEDEIESIVTQNNFRSDRAKRYANWDVDDVKQRVMEVNCDMDLEPYSDIEILEDDSDVTMLINKFYSLPDNYIPEDLVGLEEFACVQGEDYSCQDVEQIQLRKEAYDAYIEWCEAAQKEDINIRAIAGYRSYEYQAGLWNYNAEIYGTEYADEYYARPGQSEHNSGLCVDITFNGHNYNEIENFEGYEWILSNAHKYGFILRYPEDKTEVTRYGYESWHFRYVGKDAAKDIYENDWTLEEYHGSK